MDFDKLLLILDQEFIGHYKSQDPYVHFNWNDDFSD